MWPQVRRHHHQHHRIGHSHHSVLLYLQRFDHILLLLLLFHGRTMSVWWKHTFLSWHIPQKHFQINPDLIKFHFAFRQCDILICRCHRCRAHGISVHMTSHKIVPFTDDFVKGNCYHLFGVSQTSTCFIVHLSFPWRWKKAFKSFLFLSVLDKCV